MKWLDTLGAIAPTIATALGGPLAGVAVKMAADALNVDTDEKAIESAIMSGNPDALVKLKEAENNFTIKLEELGIEKERLVVQDRQSARELAKRNMTPQVVLSAIYTIGYMIVLWQFVTGEVVIPTQSQATFSIVLGVLTAAQTQILNFWFGSSSGSKEKTNQIVNKG